MGLEDGRHRIRNAGQHPLVPAFFLGFHHLPILGHGFGIIGLDIAEHVGMAENHLVADFLQDVGHIIFSLLLGNLGVENDVQHHVAQFLFQLFFVLFHDRIGKLIHFFHRHGTEAVDGLGTVPRAFGPQAVHDIEQA